MHVALRRLASVEDMLAFGAEVEHLGNAMKRATRGSRTSGGRVTYLMELYWSLAVARRTR